MSEPGRASHGSPEKRHCFFACQESTHLASAPQSDVGNNTHVNKRDMTGCFRDAE